MTMREAIYAGSMQDGVMLVTVSEGGSTRLLDESGGLAIVDRNGEGIVGNDSVGARELAHLILRDATGNEALAQSATWSFTHQFLVPIAPKTAWLITSDQIDLWLQVWRLVTNPTRMLRDSA